MHRLACERRALCDGERSGSVHREFEEVEKSSCFTFGQSRAAEDGSGGGCDYVIHDRLVIFLCVGDFPDQGTRS